MKWFFTPPAASRQTGGQGGHSHGQLHIPPAVLQRHGAVVLDPGKAALVSLDELPRHTVYRARTLLIPGDVLLNTDYTDAVTEILRGIGLVPAFPGERHPGLGPVRGNQRVTEILRGLPRPVALAPLPGFPTPVVVNAWVALQALRAGAPRLPNPPEGFSAAVGRITVEHLLVSSAIHGDPGGGWGGGIAGGPGSGSGGEGPGPNDSYLYNGGDPRTPVAVLGCLPARKPAGVCASEFGRRPVVAVVDTGIRAQPLLDVAPDGTGGYGTQPDGFVAIDTAIQAAIEAEGLTTGATDGSRHVIRDASDKPMTANALIGEANPALGHSTFIAGIVRQVTPDAQVLAIRVMHSDDIAYEGDIICALGELAKRIALAEAGDMAGMVDVVSMSFGYFDETQDDHKVTSGLWTAIQALLSLGVVVVAAAGNSASSRAYYPAAFAQRPVPAGWMPVISVGALNPNGTKAMFSNDGPYVTAWAQGSCVVSTYPVDVDGGRAPDLRDPVNRRSRGTLPPGREGMDPDDFTDGWAAWSGTSFSAPYLAALVTRALLEGAAEGGLRLDVPGQQAAADRAAAALAMLHEEARLRQEEEQRYAGRDE